MLGTELAWLSQAIGPQKEASFTVRMDASLKRRPGARRVLIGYRYILLVRLADAILK